MNDFVRPESMEVPEGGLASFLTATVGEWADDDVPQTGIAGLESVADKLAEYGRYEDTYMVHAAEGETVIPMAVFDENPRLKESLFNQMRAMGIDPEQYVVGNELNSLNPVTGQPEFFLKKFFKGLKKAVKKVVKVIKKVAPIVLSIGLSMTPLGIIAGSALGSGIGTLVQGGSLKDALKMGAIGGLTAGLFKGVAGGIGSKMGGGTFGSGFKAGVQSGLPDAVRASQAAAANQAIAQSSDALLPPPSAPSASLSTGAPTGSATTQALGRPPPSGIPANMQTTVTAAGPGAAAANPTVTTTLAGDLFPAGNVNSQATNVGAQTTGEALVELSSRAQPPGGDVGASTFYEKTPPVGSGIETTAAGSTTADALGQIQKPPGFFSSVKDMFVDTGSDKNFFEAGKNAFFPSSVTPDDIVRQRLGQEAVGKSALEVAQIAAERNLSYTDMITEAANLLASGAGKGYSPNLLRQYGPMAGAGILGLASTGGFEAPEMEEAPDPFNLGGQSAWDLVAANPAKYRVFGSGGPYNLTSTPYGAAQGGSTSDFPRRDGAIAGPGTGTSDDIPAMLSDGEFVMTAQAVRGAGNGSRENGVRKMYDIMRSYEGVA